MIPGRASFAFPGDAVTDFATLRLTIDTDGVKRGAADFSRATSSIQSDAKRIDQAVSPATAEVTRQFTRATAAQQAFARQLSTVATSSLPVNANLGRLGATLGGFALGATPTIAILAGFAAISAAISLIGEESRIAQGLIDDLLASAARRRERERPGEVFNEQVQTLLRERARLDAQRRRAEEGFETRDGRVVDETNVRRTTAAIRELDAALAEAGHKYVDAVGRINAATERTGRQAQIEADRARREAERAAREAEQRAKAAREFRTAALVAIATEQRDLATLIRTEYEQTVAGINDSFAKLSQDGQRAAAALRDAWLDAARKIRDSQLDLLSGGVFDGVTPRVVNTAQPGAPPRSLLARADVVVNQTLQRTSRTIQAWSDEVERERKARELLVRGVADAAFGAIEAAASLGVLGNEAAAAAGRIAQGAERFAGALATAQAAGGLGFANTAQAGGTLGVIGAGLGVAGTILGSIFGGGEDAHQAALRLEAARERWQRALEGFAEIHSPLSSLERAQRDLKRQFDDLVKVAAEARGISISGNNIDEIRKALEALRNLPRGSAAVRALLGDLDKLTEEYLKNIEALKKRFEEDQRLTRLDLEARALRARGLDEEAERAALNAQQQREIARALEEGWEEASLAALRHVHALELEAQARAEAERAIARQEQRNQFLGDLTVRELRLGGNDRGADQAALQFAALQREAEVRRLFREGLITEAEMARAIGLIYGELGKAMADLTKQYAEQAEQARQLERAFLADLEVRDLEARGLTEQARQRRRQLQQDREIQEAVERGLSDAAIAALRHVHALEDQRDAAQQAAEAIRELEEALERQARKVEDLTARSLAARGFADAAEEARLFFQQQDEIRRARKDGLGEDVIAQIFAVQAEERDSFNAARRARQQAAADAAEQAAIDAFQATRDSQTAVNLAVGISETTGGRIAGLLASGLTYWSALPRMEGILGRMETILRGIRDGSLDIDTVDRSLNTLAESADRVSGIPAGNR